MPNTNALAGFKCPKCGYTDKFFITGTATFAMTDAGSDTYTDLEWDNDSGCTCAKCKHTGTVSDFDRS